QAEDGIRDPLVTGVQTCALPIWLAQRAEGAQAADAKDDLLADAHVVVAAVEPAGDRPVLGAVLRDVGVEQVQRHPADLDAPDARSEERRVGKGGRRWE